MATTTIDNILSYHFNITPNRLHKSRVLDIFQMYIPSMTMRTLVPILRARGIEYSESLREFGDSYNKGVFRNLEIKVEEKNDELVIKSDTDKITTSYSGKTLAQNSVNTWSQRLKKLDSLGLQDALDNNAYDIIVDIITNESDSLNTRCTSITAILNRLYNQRVLDTNAKDIPELVQKLILLRKKWTNEINTQRSGNALNTKEKESWVDWEDVIAKRNELTDIRQKLVLGLYTYHPPRRLMDYEEMYYLDNNNVDSDSHNYCVNCDTFIFNKYKTFGKYGQQVIKITPELKSLLTRYVKECKIKSGDLLLQNLSINNTLRDIFQKNVGINTLRKSFISYFYKLPLTTLQKQDIADLMAHSVNEQLKYLKIQLKTELHPQIQYPQIVSK
jgi:hypothetical protein